MSGNEFALYEPPIGENSEPFFTTDDYQMACDYAASLSFLVLPCGRQALQEYLRHENCS